MPSAGLLNGGAYSNLITKISSKRNTATNNLLQKNIRSINNATDKDMVLLMTFNINSDAVYVDNSGSSLIGKHNTGLDRCDITYRGYEEQHDSNVTMEVKWQKTPNGSYYATMYVVDDVNDQQLNFSGIYQLTRMP